MTRNGSFSRLPIDTSPPQRAPELETGATKNNLVDLEGPRVYKGGHPAGQNENPPVLTVLLVSELLSG